MGASTLEAQNATYWKIIKLKRRLQKLIATLSSDSFPPHANNNAAQTKQKIDILFKSYRALVTDFRQKSYELRASGLHDCEPFLKSSVFSDPSEIFPSWSSVYRGATYSFASLASDGRKIYPEEGKSYAGFWQLFRNLLPKHDDRLELWPTYFGHSSNGRLRLDSHREILNELRFPLSGANLEGVIAVDLETSSLTPLTGEILEIGIVEIKGDDPKLWPRFSMKFDLSTDQAKTLGTGAEHIHGISLRDIQGKPKITDSSTQKLLQSYLCSGKKIISHNSSFEFRWLSQFVDGFFESNYDNCGLQTVIDTAVLSKFAFSLNNGEGTPSNSLKTTVEKLGLEYKEAHQAQADAAMAALAAHGMLQLVNRGELKKLNDEEYVDLLTASFG